MGIISEATPRSIIGAVGYRISVSIFYLCSFTMEHNLVSLLYF